MRPTLPSLFGPRRLQGFPALEAMRRDMEHWLDALTPFDAAAGPIGARLATPVDIAETDNEIIVSAEIAGVDPKDVEVTLTGNRLTIRGEKKSEREEKKEDYHVIERSFGAFERVLTVPDGIDPAAVKAESANGVIKILLPKPPALKASSAKIPIQSKS